MREYFTIMVKENDTSTLKLLTEKLNDNFSIDDRIQVGKSTLLTLYRRNTDPVGIGYPVGISLGERPVGESNTVGGF